MRLEAESEVSNYQLTDPDKFFEAAKKSGNLIQVVRTFTSLVHEYPDGTWRDAPYIRHFYGVDVETARGPARFTFTECVPIEIPSGILRTSGTVWRRINEAKLSFHIDQTRSGSL